MRNLILATIVCLFTCSAFAVERSGQVSFGGIQVKVIVDSDKGVFKIGESEFRSSVINTKNGRVMTNSQKVGIQTWDETLTATLFLDGGDGGNIEGFQEYKCEDLRISIVRTKSDGSHTVVKNECAFLH